MATSSDKISLSFLYFVLLQLMVILFQVTKYGFDLMVLIWTIINPALDMIHAAFRWCYKRHIYQCETLNS